jgi:DNA-binding beta-propeller fold protein YncE
MLEQIYAKSKGYLMTKKQSYLSPLRRGLGTTFYLLLYICIINPSLRAAPFAYVVCRGSNSVAVIDVAIDKIINTIPIPGSSNGLAAIAITPDNKFAYVTDDANLVVYLIDLTTNSVINETNIIPVQGGNPDHIAITPNGKYVFVTNTYANPNITFNVIDTTSNTNISGSPFSTSLIQQPGSIAISPDGTTAYMPDSGTTGNVLVANVNNPTQQTAISLAAVLLTDIAITADSNTAYVCSQAAALVYPITNLKNSPTVGTGINPNADPYPNNIIITPDNHYAYVITQDGTVNFGGKIAVIDLTTNTPLTGPNYPIQGLYDPEAMAITSNGEKVYVTSNRGNYVTVIPTSTNVPLQSVIAPLSAPSAIAITTLPSAPTNFTGCKTQNSFLLQTDFMNKLTWSAPNDGPTPASYSIYRDPALTDLVATIPASSPLQYYDHQRNPQITYSYYITTSDALGDQSLPASVTVMQRCS